MGRIVRSKAFRAFPLICYVIALIFDVWGFVDGIQLMRRSVIGGIAVVGVCLILAASVWWRISFKWKQLHSDCHSAHSP